VQTSNIYDATSAKTSPPYKPSSATFSFPGRIENEQNRTRARRGNDFGRRLRAPKIGSVVVKKEEEEDECAFACSTTNASENENNPSPLISDDDENYVTLEELPPLD